MKDPLFRSVTIADLKIKNRIFMPAMHLNMCEKFQVTEQLIEFYRRRSQGGVGLISVGYATVDRYSGNAGNIGAHDDSFLEGLEKLAEAIHSGGARASVQLNHAGRYNHSSFLGGKKPLAPSEVPSYLTRETPKEMDLAEIEGVKKSFAEAALRVKKAGFDMVEILAGTGYLISSFLSPLTNKRQDEYGGSLENRMRFGLEVVGEVRVAIGRMPLMVRINGNDFMKGGIGRNDLEQFGVKLAEVGVDVLSINVGWHEAQIPQIVTKVPRGVFAYMARDIKRRVTIPVIASHRINDPMVGRRLIGEGWCDMVAMGRALISDPDLPKKAANGDDSILHCVGCGQGCFDNLMKMKKVECLCNPMAGYESTISLEKTESPKKIVVAGGGVAGINSALGAAAKGHDVSLYEKSMKLGGQLHLAGISPGREEFLVLAEDLQKQLSRSDVKVILNRGVDPKLLQQEKPDMLIVATGGQPITPEIPGVEGDNVVQAWDVMQNGYVDGDEICIIGGGAVGVECAIMLAEQGTLSGDELKFLLQCHAEPVPELQRLALQGNKKVTIIEMSDKLGMNFGKSTRWSMLQDVERYNIGIRLNTLVSQITEDGVVVEQEGEERLVPADTVVLAVGTGSFNPLEKFANELGVSSMVVGDALSPATVFEAAHQGFRAGNGIK